MRLRITKNFGKNFLPTMFDNVNDKKLRINFRNRSSGRRLTAWHRNVNSFLADSGLKNKRKRAAERVVWVSTGLRPNLRSPGIMHNRRVVTHREREARYCDSEELLERC